MYENQLRAAVAKALERFFEFRGIQTPTELLSTVTFERPKELEHGDLSSPVALRYAKQLGSSPFELAKTLAAELNTLAFVHTALPVQPGFINVRLTSGVHAENLAKLLADPQAYGSGQELSGQRINLEFVSANPTGPVHVGGARWAAVGSALAELLRNAGAKVDTEYYLNDRGTQVDRFAVSLLAAYRKEPTPENGYAGAYITELAAELAETYPLHLADTSALLPFFRAQGLRLMVETLREDLKHFGVTYQTWTSETELLESGKVELALAQLKALGLTFEELGTLWFKSTQFGDDQDRVLIKSNGELTYFASDVAYYLDKRARGYTTALMILGADHHGYTARLEAVAQALEPDELAEPIEFLLGQLVKLVRTDPLTGEKVPVKASKRAGDVITLNDLVDAVGKDAARYGLVRSSIDRELELDLSILSSATRENPVYYVQYAHARTAAVALKAKQAGILPLAGVAQLTHASELTLLTLIHEFPKILARAAELREVHRLAHWLEELAGHYQYWYENCRVIPLAGAENELLSGQRLNLNLAVGKLIERGLTILGVSAPQRMD